MIKYLTQNLNISDYQPMETKVMNFSNGLPMAIADIIKQLSYHKVVNRRAVEEIYYEPGTVYRDWTKMIMVFWGAMVMFRFISLGSHSFEGYILAGMSGSVLLVARFFLFKLR